MDQVSAYCDRGYCKGERIRSKWDRLYIIEVDGARVVNKIPLRRT